MLIAATASSPPTDSRFDGSSWLPFIAAAGQALTEEQGLEAHRLDQSLRQALASDTLVILAGLGTSLGLSSTASGRSAPTMWNLFEKLQQLSGFDDAAKLDPKAVVDGDVEGLLSSCQYALALTSSPVVEQFMRQAEQAILESCDFIDSTSDLRTHESFLRKIARRSTRLTRTQVYTTNYDLAFETAAATAGFHLIDGFGLSSTHRFDGGAFDLDVVRRRRGESLSLEPNVFHLLKLHGSIDWDETDGAVHRRSSPAQPVLIYPSQNKFAMSYRPPYIECMARFQMALREPSVCLLTIGFGFNDAHIVAPIEAAVRGNVGLKLIVVRPDLAATDNASIQKLKQLVTAGDRRLELMNTTFSQFSRVIPELSPLDEKEIHERRSQSSYQ